MGCKRARKKIYHYVDGHLDFIEMMDFENHISRCEDCATELEVASRTVQLASSLPIRYPSSQDWANFIPELRRRIELDIFETLTVRRRFLSFENLKFAAALGALILAIFSASYSGFKVISFSKAKWHQARSDSNSRQNNSVMTLYNYDLLSEDTSPVSIVVSFRQVAPKYQRESYIPVSISDAIDQSSLIFSAD